MCSIITFADIAFVGIEKLKKKRHPTSAWSSNDVSWRLPSKSPDPKNPQQHANFDETFAQGGVDLKEKKGKRGITCMCVPEALQKRQSIQD